jgi:hypothetical protein
MPYSTEHKPKPEVVRESAHGIILLRVCCVGCGEPLQVSGSGWEHAPGTPERSSR